MPTILANLMRAEIALLSPILNKMDLNARRKLQDGLGILGAKAVEGSVRFEAEAFDNFEAAWAIPESMVASGAILYLHGGAYTAGSLAYAKGFGGVLAAETGMRVLCAAYRLAPESPYPAALEDALCAYEAVVARYPAERVALVGESAGGGLCFCLALRLKELGMKLPRKIVALSPWTDLTMTCPYDRDEALDPVLKRDDLLESANFYAEGHLKDPLVSPIYGELSGMPDSLIYVGTHEILEKDSTRIAEKLTASGAKCELHVEDGLWHVYVLYGIPEARTALSRICQFLWGDKDAV